MALCCCFVAAVREFDGLGPRELELPFPVPRVLYWLVLALAAPISVGSLLGCLLRSLLRLRTRLLRITGLRRITGLLGLASGFNFSLHGMLRNGARCMIGPRSVTIYNVYSCGGSRSSRSLAADCRWFAASALWPPAQHH
jgi:hypothetical protein